jgi:class 3 adenylate cyclase
MAKGSRPLVYKPAGLNRATVNLASEAIVVVDMVESTLTTNRFGWYSVGRDLMRVLRHAIDNIGKTHALKCMKSTGDGYLLAYAHTTSAEQSVVNAVAGSRQLMKFLHNYNRRRSTTEERRINVRIAVHFGEVDVIENDREGPNVSYTFRLGAINRESFREAINSVRAEQLPIRNYILCSERVKDILNKRMPSIATRQLGLFRFRGFEGHHEVFILEDKPQRETSPLAGGRLEHMEGDALVKSIPTLLADMDNRREEIIQRELDRMIGSGDRNLVLDMIRDVYAVLVGNNLPELPDRVGDEDEDAEERFKLLMEFIPKAKNGFEKVQEQTIKRGEEETGLLVARRVNKYLSIEDELENDNSYKKLKKKLKTAREHLPGAIACGATKAIDSYLAGSKAYKAPIAMIMPLIKMLEENDLLKGEPFVKQIIDYFQRYRDQYVKLMNEKLAKVNEALEIGVRKTLTS